MRAEKATEWATDPQLDHGRHGYGSSPFPSGGIQGIERTRRLYQLIAATPEVFAILPRAAPDEALRQAFHDGLLAAPHHGARILTSQENPEADELVLAAVNAGAEVRTHARLPTWFVILG